MKNNRAEIREDHDGEYTRVLERVREILPTLPGEILYNCETLDPKTAAEIFAPDNISNFRVDIAPRADGIIIILLSLSEDGVRRQHLNLSEESARALLNALGPDDLRVLVERTLLREARMLDENYGRIDENSLDERNITHKMRKIRGIRQILYENKQNLAQAIELF